MMNCALLYGMQTDVNWTLRISELGARLGALPKLISRTQTENALAGYRNFWLHTYRRYRFRLAVLQVWDPQHASCSTQKEVIFRNSFRSVSEI